ncbi:TetR/AcrR family transcriptional regulator C-terminal ligand-binding domain-containing protein [Paenibacillus polymyxa]|uniref:TetR-like C-terminal domain-containing protein n=1 Tax=Paenibacillus polymyxa TaxID=1406 RepID=UPI001BEB19A6|nr:TetR-like C-terminal domain-containing protein [Paenibacillus polymyxa]MBT2282252.1 TetR/AcrR family transcriptional regulator C-terminal ligand-binding domain-containing protein [Paenibacillus polymyxa]
MEIQNAILTASLGSTIQPCRREAWGILEKSVERGELKTGVDVGLYIDLIYGTVFYRMLVTGEVMDDAYVEVLLDSLFDGIGYFLAE